MGKLLEKTLSPVKTFVAAAVITTAVAGMPSEAQGKSQNKDFEYFTQSRNITTGHLISAPEKGLTRTGGYGEIKSIGNYLERGRAPRNAENIKIDIEQRNNQLEVSYFCQPKRFNERLPVYEQMLREDSVNTHIYFLFPEHVTPLKEKQIIGGINNRTMERAMHIGTPFEDTKLCEAIKNINIATEEGARPRDCDTQELERAYDNTADAIGGMTGAGMKGLKKITKWGMNRAEKKRIKKIKETYGEDYQIHKMPFHQIDGPVFKYTYYGRKASLFLDTSEVVEGDKAYIVIPQLSFTQDVAGTTRRATLENLAYEIPLERFIPEKNIQESTETREYSKEDIYKKYPERKRREILEGAWESLEGGKIIEINFERGRNQPRRWGDWSTKGTYEEKWKNGKNLNSVEKEWNKKFMIIHDKSVKDSSKYMLFLDDINLDWSTRGPTRIKTLDIMVPEIIEESEPTRYFVREGITTEKRNSLKNLIRKVENAGFGDLNSESSSEAGQPEEIFKKYSPGQMRRILNGKWNSLKEDRTITISLKKDTRHRRRQDQDISRGTFTDDNTKEVRALEECRPREGSNNYWVREYTIREDGFRNEISKHTFSIVTPNIIEWCYYPFGYLVKEGTKIERLNSLEDLAGTWKIKESFLKNPKFSPKQQEIGKSWKTIIKKDKVILEQIKDGKLEREVDKILTVAPVIKVNSFYFIPNEKYYSGFIIKINENNLLMPMGDMEVPLIKDPLKKKQTEVIEFEVDESGHVRPKRK